MAPPPGVAHSTPHPMNDQPPVRSLAARLWAALGLGREPAQPPRDPMLAANPDLMLRLDRRGRIRGVSAGGAALLPRPAGELAGHRVRDVMPAAFAEPI